MKIVNGLRHLGIELRQSIRDTVQSTTQAVVDRMEGKYDRIHISNTDILHKNSLSLEHIYHVFVTYLLKRHSCIFKTERHTQKFEKSEWRYNSRFWHGGRVERNVDTQLKQYAFISCVLFHHVPDSPSLSGTTRTSGREPAFPGGDIMLLSESSELFFSQLLGLLLPVTNCCSETAVLLDFK